MILGVIFDSPKLTFKKHLNYIIQETKKRLNTLRALSSIRWGANRNLLRRVYLSFIRSRIEYGIAIYGNLCQSDLRKLEVLQNQALRCILGARKTSPITSMEAEAYVLPIHIRIEYLQLKWYIKLMHRDENDNTLEQLKLHSHKENSPFKEETKALIGVMQVPSIQRVTTPVISPIPPWCDPKEHIYLDLPGRTGTMTATMQDLTEAVLEERFLGYTQIYTDGSKLESGSVSAAFYVPCLNKSVGWLMSPNHTILGAELFAMYKALEFSLSTNEIRKTNLVILSDSMSGLHLIRDGRCPSYKQMVYKIQILIEQKKRLSKVSFQWVKSHSNIRGNEIADKVAGMSHKNDKSVLTKLNYEEALKMLNSKLCDYWKRLWKFKVIYSGVGSFYSDMVEMPKLCLWKAHKSRSLECATTRLRLGHVGVGKHMHRFNMNDTAMCQFCNTEDDIRHFLLFCRRFNMSRTSLKTKLSNIQVEFNLKNIIGCGNFNAKKQRQIQKYLTEYLLGTDRVEKL